MKSTIQEKSKEITYPCLLQFPASGVIVLMTAARWGTVVHGVSKLGNTVGEHCGNWNNTGIPFDGTIILENGK